jgi:hypothetical protein
MTHAGGKADVFFPYICMISPVLHEMKNWMDLFHTDFSECEPHLHIMCSLFRSHCLITSIVIPSSFFLLMFVKHKLNIM